MIELMGKPERFRVWVFGFAKNPEEIMKNIEDPSDDVFKRFFEVGGDDYVIVRADMVDIFTVDGFDCNIVIPVDARNEEAFINAKSIINDRLSIKTYKDVRVVLHAPWSPHRAHGYITERENVNLPDDKAGRQSHKSPGSNKWG